MLPVNTENTVSEENNTSPANASIKNVSNNPHSKASNIAAPVRISNKGIDKEALKKEITRQELAFRKANKIIEDAIALKKIIEGKEYDSLEYELHEMFKKNPKKEEIENEGKQEENNQEERQKKFTVKDIQPSQSLKDAINNPSLEKSINLLNEIIGNKKTSYGYAMAIADIPQEQKQEYYKGLDTLFPHFWQRSGQITFALIAAIFFGAITAVGTLLFSQLLLGGIESFTSVPGSAYLGVEITMAVTGFLITSVINYRLIDNHFQKEQRSKKHALNFFIDDVIYKFKTIANDAFTDILLLNNTLNPEKNTPNIAQLQKEILKATSAEEIELEDFSPFSKESSEELKHHENAIDKIEEILTQLSNPALKNWMDTRSAAISNLNIAINGAQSPQDKTQKLFNGYNGIFTEDKIESKTSQKYHKCIIDIYPDKGKMFLRYALAIGGAILFGAFSAAASFTLSGFILSQFGGISDIAGHFITISLAAIGFIIGAVINYRLVFNHFKKKERAKIQELSEFLEPLLHNLVESKRDIIIQKKLGVTQDSPQQSFMLSSQKFAPSWGKSMYQPNSGRNAEEEIFGKEDILYNFSEELIIDIQQQVKKYREKSFLRQIWDSRFGDFNNRMQDIKDKLIKSIVGARQNAIAQVTDQFSKLAQEHKQQNEVLAKGHFQECYGTELEDADKLNAEKFLHGLSRKVFLSQDDLLMQYVISVALTLFFSILSAASAITLSSWGLNEVSSIFNVAIPDFATYLSHASLAAIAFGTAFIINYDLICNHFTNGVTKSAKKLTQYLYNVRTFYGDKKRAAILERSNTKAAAESLQEIGWATTKSAIFSGRGKENIDIKRLSTALSPEEQEQFNKLYGNLRKNM